MIAWQMMEGKSVRNPSPPPSDSRARGNSTQIAQGESVAGTVHFHQHRSELGFREKHHGMRPPKFGGRGVPPVARHHVDRAVFVCPVAQWIPVPRVENVPTRLKRGRIRRGEIWKGAIPIGPEQGVGPFIDVRVPGKHEVNSASFQYRKNRFAHENQTAPRINVVVGIMTPF